MSECHCPTWIYSTCRICCLTYCLTARTQVMLHFIGNLITTMDKICFFLSICANSIRGYLFAIGDDVAAARVRLFDVVYPIRNLILSCRLEVCDSVICWILRGIAFDVSSIFGRILQNGSWTSKTSIAGKSSREKCRKEEATRT